MSTSIDYSVATGDQIQRDLCTRLERLRLSRNRTQAQVATDAGISTRTLARLENGEGVTLDSFVRVLGAFGLQGNLDALIPNPLVRPIERVRNTGQERQRARPPKESERREWSWSPRTENDSDG